MSRLPRYLLIWLSCTAASVTAVMLTVHFVVGSTRPTAPVARSAPDGFDASPAASVSPSPPPSRKPSPTPPSRKPGPAPTRTTAEPRPSPSPTPRTSTPAPPPPTRGAGADAEAGCAEGGSGVHTIDSEGGKATVRFGSGGVCLISAVPSQGFTASTRQSAPQALTVTFAADRHRSEITASTEPSDRASVRETSF
ncbi:hypothetical protein [Streptomyces zhihengii]